VVVAIIELLLTWSSEHDPVGRARPVLCSGVE